jgi:hypothetical protein
MHRAIFSEVPMREDGEGAEDTGKPSDEAQ